MSGQDAFNPTPAETKSVTNREGDGLSVGENPSTYAAAPVKTFGVTVKEGVTQGGDVTRTFTGPGAGIAQGLASPTDAQGWITATGNRVTITGTAGAETIELVHHSGAAIQIDADGSIFLTPSSKRGFGLHAGKGDGLVSAQNRLVIKGTSSISLETEGSMEFNVGKNLFMDVGGDYVLNVRGTTYVASDGTYTTECAKDRIDIIGGIERKTIAGDQRTQVAGQMRADVGKDIELRTDQTFKTDAQKSVLLTSKEYTTLTSSEQNVNLVANEDVTASAKENVRLLAKEDVTLDAQDNITVRSYANMIVSSQGKILMDSDLDTTITSGDNLVLDSQTKTTLRSNATDFYTTGTAKIFASGEIDMRGSPVNTNKGSPSPVSPLQADTTTPRVDVTIVAPEAAEYPDSNTVIDSVTSEREAPDFPFNATKMSAEEMSRYENEGDTPNPKAKARTDPNQGAGSPYSQGPSSGVIPDSASITYDGSGNQTQGSNNPYPAPSSLLNSADKLSRYMTIGMFGNLSMCPANQMGLSRAEILENARHLSYNILDPVLEKFGNAVTILPNGAGLRIGSGGSRHYLGKAHDLRASSRDGAETAMIAKWMVENLPFDRLFLEANNYGSIHIHVEAAPPGSTGARVVWTCSDPKCNGRTDGLNLQYAQQGLRRMGFA